MVFLATHVGGSTASNKPKFSQLNTKRIRWYAPEAGTDCLVAFGHCRFGRFDSYHPRQVFISQRTHSTRLISGIDVSSSSCRSSAGFDFRIPAYSPTSQDSSFTNWCSRRLFEFGNFYPRITHKLSGNSSTTASKSTNECRLSAHVEFRPISFWMGRKASITKRI